MRYFEYSLSVIFCLFCFNCKLVQQNQKSSENSEDEVFALPGLHKPLNFKQYAGFLKASHTTNLFYWFVEAEKDAAIAPLVLWLNGGPGCSSVGGLIQELGPFILNDNMTFRRNPYAWNKNANLLVFESPAGVGYTHTSSANVSLTDDQTADENYAALKAFLIKFNNLRHRPLFVTGESYAGIYIPTLVERIIRYDRDFHINLKGVAMGNALLSNALNTDTAVQFSYTHALIDQSLWQMLETSCCNGCMENCTFSRVRTGFCKYNILTIIGRMWYGGLNPYDLYRDCVGFSLLEFKDSDKKGKESRRRPVLSERYVTSMRGLAHKDVVRTFDQSVKSVASEDRKKKKTVIVDPVCTDSTAIVAYMNSVQVRRALHVPVSVPQWTHCSDKVSGTYRKQYGDVYSQVRRLLTANIRLLLYYGDTDMACNFLMGQQFAKNLKLPLIAAKRPWAVDEQISGFVTRYRGLDYLTVKGTGHMVPQWKPKEAFYMISRFLSNNDY